VPLGLKDAEAIGGNQRQQEELKEENITMAAATTFGI
jgi:hypothetical protein